MEFQSLDDGYPPVGEIVTCKREGDWSGAKGLWNGKGWEGKTQPDWIRDRMLMQIPTHWKR